MSHVKRQAAASSSMDQMLPFVFDLEASCLVVVDSGTKLHLLGSALASSVMLGIDTETKPTFIPKHLLKGKPHPTALIQIASRSDSGDECVFIVDMLALSTRREWLLQLDSLLRTVFKDDSCIKLGQGLAQDIKELAQAYPDLPCFRIVRGIIETHSVVRYLDPSVLQQQSLKNLVAAHLHSKLSKAQQMSNWAYRPLSSDQLHYAACDALVLLRLFDAMQCKIEQSLGAEGASLQALLQKAVKSLHTDVDLSQPGALEKKKKVRGFRERVGAAVDSGVQGLNISLLRGWNSQPAKDWYKTQAESSSSGASSSGAGSSGSSSGTGRAVSASTVGAKRPAPQASIVEDSGSSSSGGTQAHTQARKKVRAGKAGKTGSAGKGAKGARVEASIQPAEKHVPLPAGSGRHVKY
jgi:ribonuclease D